MNWRAKSIGNPLAPVALGNTLGPNHGKSRSATRILKAATAGERDTAKLWAHAITEGVEAGLVLGRTIRAGQGFIVTESNTRTASIGIDEPDAGRFERSFAPFT